MLAMGLLWGLAEKVGFPNSGKLFLDFYPKGLHIVWPHATQVICGGGGAVTEERAFTAISLEGCRPGPTQERSCPVAAWGQGLRTAGCAKGLRT